MTQQRVSPVSITSVLPATVTLSVQGALGQSVDLQRWQSSTGSVYSYVNPNGNFIVSAGLSVTGNLGGVANMVVYGSAGSTRVSQVIQQGAAQTGDAFQVQSSAGTVLAKVQSNGLIYSGTGLAAPYVSDGAANGPYLDFTTANKLILQTRNAAYVGLTVKGAASQSANLQEWQTSAGTIVARVAPTGSLLANTLQTVDGLAVIAQESSGASIRMLSLTAAGANPGPGQGKLYFRDGTNAGTLKLVVRAGAAGAETTILDNIPQ